MQFLRWINIVISKGGPQVVISKRLTLSNAISTWVLRTTILNVDPIVHTPQFLKVGDESALKLLNVGPTQQIS